MRKSLFFNSFIVLWNEALLMTCICILIGLENLSFATSGQSIQSILILFFAAQVIIAPIYLSKFLLKNFKELNSE